MLNKLSKRILAISLCCVLGAGSISAVYAINNDEGDDKQEEKIIDTIFKDDEPEDISKDETVYVLAGADGSVKKIIVSDWIKNNIGSVSINDKTGLSDIQNVKGNESYSLSGDNMTVWDAEGNDIYYQGNIEKELPVNLSISYKLDGEPVSAEEIAGKDGKVTIRFDYDNKQYETVKINGEDEDIYVPFAMLTGMLLDGDTFKNVEVSNGKLLNDGDHTAVIGIAFPGLQEDLAIDEEKLDIPDYVEITADVTNFKLGMTVTIATNEVFNKFSEDKLDSVDDIKDKIGDLKDGMSQLLDGSSQLYDGICTLLTKSNELVDGVNKLADGALTLKNGTVTLDDNVLKLKDGAKELSDGLTTLKSNNDALNGGAKQVFETLLSTVVTQLEANGLTVPKLTIENYAEVLNQVISSLDSTSVYNQALKQVTDAVEDNKPLIIEKVTEGVREQVEIKVADAVKTEVEAKVTEAVKAEVTKKVTAAVKEQVIEKVTEAVRLQVIDKVTEAARSEVAEKVTEAARIQVTGQVTDTVRKQVEGQVESTVKDQVSRAVIFNATGKSKEEYDIACQNNLIPESVQNTINQAIDNQMNSTETKELITEKTDTQMASSSVLGLIDQNVEIQMESNDVKALINSNIDNQMNSDTVKNKINENVESQMAGEYVKQTIQANTSEQMKTDTVQKTIDSNVAEQMLTDTVLISIKDNTDSQMETDDIKKTINENVDAQMTTDTVKASIDENVKIQVEKAISENMASEEVQSKLAQASDGAKTIIGLKTSLDSYNTFYLGLLSYTGGVASAADGASQIASGTEQLKDGTKQLKDGATQLYDGIVQFKNGVPSLVNGVSQLKDGAMKLNDGLKKFNEEGIQKITNYIEDNLNDVVDRLKATINVSKNYRNFSGISDEMGGQVKFIYRTDEINN